MDELKQITELALDIDRVASLGLEISGAIARDLHDEGYRKEQEWISVDERLPETEGDYLVWNKEQKKIEIRFFYRLPPNYPVEDHPEIREYFGNVSDYKKITHWMPLPQPPKMKGAER